MNYIKGQLTRDNLKKRNMDKPEECIFCTENETISHPIHESVVAKLWKIVSYFFYTPLGLNLESLSIFWLSQKRNSALNSICACVLWCIWKTRNSGLV
jgi:hypothetical protein